MTQDVTRQAMLRSGLGFAVGAAACVQHDWRAVLQCAKCREPSPMTDYDSIEWSEACSHESGEGGLCVKCREPSPPTDLDDIPFGTIAAPRLPLAKPRKCAHHQWTYFTDRGDGSTTGVCTRCGKQRDGALEARSIRSGGEFHVWAEERMVTEARDEAKAALARLPTPADLRGLWGEGHRSGRCPDPDARALDQVGLIVLSIMLAFGGVLLWIGFMLGRAL